ncbi:MAG: DUF92 domain-containing protein [Thermomicrobiales bacterium]
MSPSWFDHSVVRFITGTAAAILIAAVAWRARALVPSGAIAAIVTGALVVGCGGWWAGVLLVTFFITSSAISRAGKQPSRDLLPVRGSQRDAIQVLANGGVAAICALALAITGHAAWTVALAASLATANADTWATEIGRLSGQRPRSIVTLRPVLPGTSGGVSFAGTIAAFAGAALIGIVAVTGWNQDWLANPAPASDLAHLLMIVTGCGFAGSLVDSLLGATVQAQYRCPTCGKTTESPTHTCGTATTLVRGIRWVTNDVVNVTSILVATGLAGWFVHAIS